MLLYLLIFIRSLVHKVVRVIRIYKLMCLYRCTKNKDTVSADVVIDTEDDEFQRVFLKEIQALKTH